MPETRSRKGWVRPHKTSYWEAGWNKLTGKKEKKKSKSSEDGDRHLPRPPQSIVVQRAEPPPMPSGRTPTEPSAGGNAASLPSSSFSQSTAPSFQPTNPVFQPGSLVYQPIDPPTQPTGSSYQSSNTTVPQITFQGASHSSVASSLRIPSQRSLTQTEANTYTVSPPISPVSQSTSLFFQPFNAPVQPISSLVQPVNSPLQSIYPSSHPTTPSSRTTTPSSRATIPSAPQFSLHSERHDSAARSSHNTAPPSLFQHEPSIRGQQQQEQTVLPTANFPRSSHRTLAPGELRTHEQPGGMTYLGFPVRGMEGETVFIGSRAEGSSVENRSGVEEGGLKSQHAWYPRKSEFDAEKTRMGRGGG